MVLGLPEPPLGDQLVLDPPNEPDFLHPDFLKACTMGIPGSPSGINMFPALQTGKWGWGGLEGGGWLHSARPHHHTATPEDGLFQTP